MNGLHWSFLFFGFWLVVSPWILGLYEINTVVINNVTIGVLIIVAALWALYGKK